MSSSSSLEFSSSTDEEFSPIKTPRKKRYKRSIHFGFNKKRALYYGNTEGVSSREISNNFGRKTTTINCSVAYNEHSSIGNVSNIETLLDMSTSESDCSISDYEWSSTLALSSRPSSTATSINDSINDNESNISSEGDTTDQSSHNGENLDNNAHDSLLFEGSKQTLASSYTMIILFVMKHSLSKDAFTDLLNLILLHLPKDNKFSPSMYKVKEFLKRFIGMKDPKLHKFCEYCQGHFENTERCRKEICRRNDAKVLQYHDLRMEDQIQNLFKDDHFCSMIFEKKSGPLPEEHGIQVKSDICDGTVYSDLSTHYFDDKSEVLNLTLTMNTDGVAVFSSSKKGNLWPLYVAINELPIKFRFSKKYIIPCFLYCQTEKPNMLSYLQPMMETLKLLSDKGMEVDTPKGKWVVKFHLLATTLDLPAKAIVCNMKQFNGKYGCTVCFDEGETAGNNALCRYWPYNEDSQIRTHDLMIQHAKQTLTMKKGESVYGVKGPSSIAALKYVDLSKHFVIDWMHSVLLGVCKTLLSLWFDSANNTKEYYIGKKISLANERLLAIQIPDFIPRRQRCIEEHKHWKASECREWLFHFSIPVLKGILNPSAFVHYSLLVTSMVFLNNEAISPEDIDKSERMLQDFCRHFPTLYESGKQTMNIHLLRHLPNFVRLYGPLFTFSCFGFESMNAYIKKMVHGTRHVNSQVAFAVALTKSIPSMMKRFIDKTDDHSFKLLAQSLLTKFTSEDKVNLGRGILGVKKSYLPSEEEKNLLKHHKIDTAAASISVYYRFESSDCVYYSEQYKRTQTNSYTVKFMDGGEEHCGKIKFFLEAESICFAVIDVLSLIDQCVIEFQGVDSVYLKYRKELLCPHIQIMSSKSIRKAVVPVRDIIRKCVYMEYGKGKCIVSSPPNLVEHS